MPQRELLRQLRTDGVHLVTGACTFHLRSAIDRLVPEFTRMYGAYRTEDPRGIADASLYLRPHRTLRRPFEARVRVTVNDEHVLDGLPVSGAYAALESALNWCVALSDVAPLLMHAAVLERDNRAVILPAPSGSGKSTLCAALACSGWRLFSDEMAIFSAADFSMLPNPRPVSLKNRSIDIIRHRYPAAQLSRVVHDTPKGDIAFMRAPRDAVERCLESAPAALVIRPLYQAGATVSARRMARTDAFRLLTDNAVNYASMLRLGFDAVTTLVESCDCYELTYSELDAAIDMIGQLHRAHAS